MNGKTSCRHFLVKFCILTVLAAVFMAAQPEKCVQKVQAADLLDNVLVKAPDQKVTDFKVSGSTIDSVTLTWKKASDAQTYYISYWESGKPSTSVDREDIGDVSECRITNLKQAKYIFQIQPANKLHTGIPLKGSITSVEGAPGAAVPVNVRINHVQKGYCSVFLEGLETIYRSEAEVYDASGNLIESGEGDSAGAAVEDADIKNNGFYAVRVRGFYDQEGGYRSYGEWSGLQYFSTAVNQPKLTQKNARVTAKWTGVQGAQSYTVYISKSASRGFQKAAQVTNPSAVVAKYGNAKLKSGKTYYIKVTARMARDGETYTVSSPAAKIKIK